MKISTDEAKRLAALFTGGLSFEAAADADAQRADGGEVFAGRRKDAAVSDADWKRFKRRVHRGYSDSDGATPEVYHWRM